MKLKTEFDPETRFQQILMEQIDEIERKEFQEEDIDDALPIVTDNDGSRTIRNITEQMGPAQNNSIQKYELI